MKQPVKTKAKPALTLAAAKKQIAILKGKVTKMETAVDNANADRVYAIQQQKATSASREKLYNEMKALRESYDHLSDKNKELADVYHKTCNDFVKFANRYEKDAERLKSDLNNVQQVSDNWKKAYNELIEAQSNTFWNRLIKWIS
jgi:chromosome segregation ATPase